MITVVKNTTELIVYGPSKFGENSFFVGQWSKTTSNSIDTHMWVGNGHLNNVIESLKTIANTYENPINNNFTDRDVFDLASSVACHGKYNKKIKLIIE